jgi:hypothetical protein
MAARAPSPAPSADLLSPRRWIVRAIGLVGLLLALLLISDTTTRQAEREPDVSPGALALSRAMLNLAMPEGTVLHMRPVLVQGFVDRDHLELRTAERIVSDILEPQLNASLPLLEGAIARIWMSQFAPDEIQDLRAYVRDRSPEKTAAFLDTPLGQKYEILRDAIDAAVRSTIRLWLIKTSHAAFALHANEMRRYGLDPATGDRLSP